MADSDMGVWQLIIPTNAIIEQDFEDSNRIINETLSTMAACKQAIKKIRFTWDDSSDGLAILFYMVFADYPDKKAPEPKQPRRRFDL